MDADDVLSQFTIPTPCSMDWNRMRGDDRRRFCEACGKHVYNLTAMSTDEIATLISPLREHRGELCGQAFQRPDGTLVTSACQPGLPAAKGWQFRIRSLMAVIAALAAWFGFTRWLADQSVVRGAMRVIPSNSAPGAGNPSSCQEGSENAEAEFTVEHFSP
jgi:hypothetical protein